MKNKKEKAIKGTIVSMKKLVKEGFDETICHYRANACFKGSTTLERVFVLTDFCLAISDDGKQALVFKKEEQHKSFELVKLYEN
jgi:hypothetical protein